MKPKSQETAGQSDLFNPRLADILNPRHELYRLANLIDWPALDNEFGQFFSPDQGVPALPTRLVAGLHYLKHAFACSDEAVVERWVENPYWRQYLCGEEFFRHQLPCHPTSLTKWRNRIGEAGCEWLLSVVIQAGVASQTVKPNDFPIPSRSTPHPRKRPSLTPPTASCMNAAGNTWSGSPAKTASSYGRITTAKPRTCC